MTYAYDQWAQMPVRDLYDTQMMAMAINAAKDMYEKGQQELKDFKKEYGDFSSPFVKDMQAYGKMMKGVRDIVDTAYANGIDLARSPEGRMIIQKAINSIDPAVYNEMKENAKWGTLYKQAEMELKAKDKFSQDAEDFYRRSQGLPSFEEFSTIGDKGEHNQWRSTSPIAFQTLAEATNGWYDKRTPYELTAEQAKRELGSAYDPRKTYTGFLDEDLMNIAGQNTPGWQGSFWSEYYRDLAARQIAARGETPTADAVEKQLQRNVADANQEWLIKPIGKVDEFALADLKQKYAIQLENLRHKHNKDLKGDSSNGGNGSKSKEVTSYGATLLQRGIANWAGSGDPGVAGLERAHQFAQPQKNVSLTERTKNFLDFYSMPDAESTSAWVNRFYKDSSRTKDAAVGGINYVPSIDNKKLYSAQEVTSNTLYYPGFSMGHTKKDIPQGSSMVPTGRVYTAPMQDGTYSQFVEVKVGDSEKSQTLFYKVAETEPSPMLPTDLKNQYRAEWVPSAGDKTRPVAPYGFVNVPSQATLNQWAIQDAGLNAAAGLAGSQVHEGQGEFLDYLIP